MLFTKFNMMAEIQAECVLQRIILFKDRVLRTEIWISKKVRQNSNNVSQTDSHVSVLKGCWRPIVRLSHPHTAIWHLNCAFIIWVCLGKLSSLERNIDDTTGRYTVAARNLMLTIVRWFLLDFLGVRVYGHA